MQGIEKIPLLFPHTGWHQKDMVASGRVYVYNLSKWIYGFISKKGG